MAMLPQAHAADSARLSVSGTIVPPPCSISLGNSLIDLGTIQTASLRQLARHTRHAAARFSFHLECAQPSQVRMRFTDNQADSVPQFYHDRGEATRYGRPNMFGLGKVAGKNIGTYSMYFASGSLKSGTTTVQPVYDDGPGQQPGQYLDENYNYVITTAPLGWAVDPHVGATSLDRVDGEIVLSYMLEQPHELPLEREITFNGWATIDLEY
jgi:type 1 fimbria pilin